MLAADLISFHLLMWQLVIGCTTSQTSDPIFGSDGSFPDLKHSFNRRPVFSIFPCHALPIMSFISRRSVEYSTSNFSRDWEGDKLGGR